MNHLKERILQLEQDLKQSHAHEEIVGDLLEKKLNEIFILYHISRTIGSHLDLQEMLRQVIDILKKSLPFDRVSLYLLDEKQGEDSTSFFLERTGHHTKGVSYR